jgi:hypothetical protein
MICFYHPDKPAIGLCKYCQRGLCSDCAALVISTPLNPRDDSLACKNRHEGQVHALEEMTKQNILKSKRARSDYVRNTVFYGIVGLLFTAFGVSQLKWLGLQAIVYAVIGLALLYAAVANYLESRKYK